MTNPNLEQEKAIKTIDSNVIVNAGAGTGKTKVLTERYINILENGKFDGENPIESIVAITFTNKATQEMIERIRQEIKEKALEDDTWMNHYRDMEKANISTIHGFCAKILRENPIEANINPYFEIFDQGLSDQYLTMSILKLLNEYLESDDRLLEAMLLFNYDQVDRMVDGLKAVYRDIMSLGIDYGKIRENLEVYMESLEVRTENIEEIKDLTNFLMDNFRKGTKLLKFKESDMWIDFNNNNYQEKDLFDYLEAILESLGASKVEKDSQDRLKELIGEILESKELNYKWLYQLIIDLVEDIDEDYEKLKRAKGGLDYDDLQIKALRLLDRKDILKKYQKKYKYFMIDEFQDTNELQKKIFYKLTSVNKPLDRNNLFVVGDPKQSIYGFRGADVAVFYDVMEDISQQNKDNVITLGVNYRSLDIVMNFVNNIFEKFMGDLYDPLDAFNKNKREDLKIEVIEKADLEEIEGLSPSERASSYEADIMAKRIKELKEDRETEIDYGDIGILFRATSRIDIYEEALDRYNIPYYNSSSKKFYEKQEIKDLITALKALANSHDKIAHIGFLKSPLVGLNDESIYKIFKNKQENIFEHLENLDKDNFEDDEKIKLENLIELYDYFYHIKDFYSVDMLIEEIIYATDYIESLLLSDAGQQRAANVSKFIDITRTYYREELGSLEDYVDYLEKIRLLDESEETIEMENANVVKLMTVHGSKGLEFPVVFLPELSKRGGGGSPIFIYDKEDGLAINNGIVSGKYDRLRAKLRQEDQEEDKRVLYVAMTRAEKLLVLGFQGRNSGMKKEIYKMVEDEDVKRIAEIELEEKGNKSLKNLEIRDFKEVLSREDAKPKLLYEIDGYELTKINNYSISQYMEFKKCRRSYFFKYMWKIELPESRNEDLVEEQEIRKMNYDYKEGYEKTILEANVRGNIVHDFCNNYRMGMDIEEVMAESISSYNLEPSQEICKEIRPYIDNYLNNYKEDYLDMYSEKPFYLSLENGYISGIIDRINIYPDSLEIVDFKTNRVNDNLQEHIDYYNPQLRLYAYAMKEIVDLKVQSSNILFLETGDKVEIDISQKKLEENIEDVNHFVDYINKYQNIDKYDKSENCSRYCDYKEFCNQF